MEKIGRTKIVDLLKRTDIGAMVNVKGWVRTRRGSKQVNFIALNDGSTINNLQVVVDLANFDEVQKRYDYQMTTGRRKNQFFGLIFDGYYNSWEDLRPDILPMPRGR